MSANTPKARKCPISLARLAADPDYGRLVTAYTAANIEAEEGTLSATAAATLDELRQYPGKQRLERARVWLVRHNYLRTNGTYGRAYAAARERHEKRLDARNPNRHSEAQLSALIRDWPSLAPEAQAEIAAIVADDLARQGDAK